MHERCSGCGLKYERAPGYFLGSAYINYGWTGLLLLGLYVGLHFGAGVSNSQLAFPLSAIFVLVPCFTFRHARSLWMAIDCVLDPTGFEEEP